MKNKSFLNKFKELKPLMTIHHESERKLLPRLKFMGYVLLTISLITFGFALNMEKENLRGPNADPDNAFTSPQEMTQSAGLSLEDADLKPSDILNFFAISITFAAVGGSCFLIAWKKQKTLFSEKETNEE